MDEESEWITIETDSELLTGIELSPALLRLKIESTPTLTIPTKEPNPVVEQKNDSNETLPQEKRCRKNWRKNCDNTEDGGSTRGKWRKNCEDTETEDGGCRKGKWRKQILEKKFPQGGPALRGRGWRRLQNLENSDSDSLEERTSEEIKKEINSLKEEIESLANKKKGIWDELVRMRTEIKTLRQTTGAKEDILKLREQIIAKKKETVECNSQITNSKNRIWKLKSALLMKVD